MFRGHTNNPMSANDHEIKFMSSSRPIFGNPEAQKLFAVLSAFDKPGSLAGISELMSSR